MTAILDRCPFFDHPTEVVVAGESVLVRPFQIVVWVGLRVGEVLSSPFPAVVDTGLSLNLSIREEQLLA